MNKKIIIPIAIVLVVVGGAGVLVARRSSEAERAVPAQTKTPSINSVAEDNAQLPVATAGKSVPTSQPSSAQSPVVTGHFSGESDIEGSDVQVFEVVYNGTSFSPSSLSVKSGDVVIFKNQSKVGFQPASNPHPAHTDYPAFDARQSVPAGKSYQFTFTQVGTWKYHDHLNPSAQGSVTVAP